uniref:Uncharacterized protein n=1 Tax=Salvator merianae TaxID=96440 RepID=A0A8D0E3D8_SALMN
MAPKKTKSKEKKGTGEATSISAIFATERERYLQKEFAILSEHISTYTQRSEHFKSENEFLDKEAQQIRENSKAYLTYLAKRTIRCQDTIITLNDQNRTDLANVLKQKEELTAQYTGKETEVRSQLIEMETKYSLMNKEVEELKPFKELQSEQLNRMGSGSPKPLFPSAQANASYISSGSNATSSPYLETLDWCNWLTDCFSSISTGTTHTWSREGNSGFFTIQLLSALQVP